MKITVKVFPKAKQEKIVQDGNLYKAYVNTPPVNGKANKRLIEILAVHFRVKKYNIHILRGETSREKIIEIDETG